MRQDWHKANSHAQTARTQGTQPDLNSKMAT
eukprot:CAMPEP_0175218194 /NCGR_PEP_ID=MMETSP0093-20121207/18635_1 /TAXON_ID=311494 /ORGANISM="Alexandrium monilatum, Strain CCMP3105" /LENGTH=30 /DNA_ID= /DNA_START= /DNA_END= /DNA_ORIENTATION=